MVTGSSLGLGNSLAGEGIHALVHHHDAHSPVILASSSCSPTHLDVLPTLHPPALPTCTYACAHTPPLQGSTVGPVSLYTPSAMTWHSASTTEHSMRRCKHSMRRCKHSTSWHSTAQCSTAQPRTAQHRTRQGGHKQRVAYSIYVG